jgi:hypothetical protein
MLLPPSIQYQNLERCELTLCSSPPGANPTALILSLETSKMASQNIKVVFGTIPIGNSDPWIDEEYLNRAFSILEAHGVDTIDTARLYGQAEKRLGEVKAGARFTLDTKWPGGFVPGRYSREHIVEDAKDSIAKLGVKQVREKNDPVGIVRLREPLLASIDRGYLLWC